MIEGIVNEALPDTGCPQEGHPHLPHNEGGGFYGTGDTFSILSLVGMILLWIMLPLKRNI
jgi:hypothetical protein